MLTKLNYHATKLCINSLKRIIAHCMGYGNCTAIHNTGICIKIRICITYAEF